MENEEPKSQTRPTCEICHKNYAQIEVYGGEKGDFEYIKPCLKCQRRLNRTDKYYLALLVGYTYGVIKLFKYIVSIL